LKYPSKFQLVFVSSLLLQRRHSAEVNQTLHDVWPSPGLVHYIYIFGGSCPLTEFCHMQKSLCIQVWCSPILAGSLHGIRAVVVCRTLRCGTRNGITELSHLVYDYFSCCSLPGRRMPPPRDLCQDVGMWCSSITQIRGWAVCLSYNKYV